MATSEAANLARDLREFKTVRATLQAEEAAARWLALYDRFWMLPPAALMKAAERGPLQVKGDDAPSVSALMSAVPSPPAWAALKSLVLARPAGGRGPSETLLRLTVSCLTRDQAGVSDGLAALKSAAAGEELAYLVGLIAASAARPELDLVSRLGIREQQVGLLLAMDRVDEAVRVLGETLRVDAGRETPQARLPG